MSVKLNKKEIEIINNLESENDNIIISTLKKLHKTGKPKLITSIAALLKSNNEEIQKEVLALLSNIKDKEAVPFIIDALKSTESQKEKLVLLSSCWQSGLDFTKYYSFFVDIAINEDYEIAFEVFTILESIIPELEKEVLSSLCLKINNSLSSYDKEKLPLMKEFLKSFS